MSRSVLDLESSWSPKSSARQGMQGRKDDGDVTHPSCTWAYRLGCYLLDVRGSGASGVELIGYGGYKFVGSVPDRHFRLPLLHGQTSRSDLY